MRKKKNKNTYLPTYLISANNDLRSFFNNESIIRKDEAFPFGAYAFRAIFCVVIITSHGHFDYQRSPDNCAPGCYTSLRKRPFLRSSLPGVVAVQFGPARAVFLRSNDWAFRDDVCLAAFIIHNNTDNYNNDISIITIIIIVMIIIVITTNARIIAAERWSYERFFQIDLARLGAVLGARFGR